MGNAENEKTPAGRYLKVRMEQVGYRRKTDLATAAGVSPSTITRLFTVPTYRPDVENTRKLAAALQVGPDELMAGMAGESPTVPTAPNLHPLAAELGRMLAADSPLSESAKALHEEMVDRVIAPARREVRTTPAVEAPGEQSATDHPQLAELATLLGPGSPLTGRARDRLTAILKVAIAEARDHSRQDRDGIDEIQPMPHTPPGPGRQIDLWLEPGSPLSDRDRAAIGQAVTGIIHLAEQAVIAHDRAAQREEVLAGPVESAR